VRSTVRRNAPSREIYFAVPMGISWDFIALFLLLPDSPRPTHRVAPCRLSPCRHHSPHPIPHGVYCGLYGARHVLHLADDALPIMQAALHEAECLLRFARRVLPIVQLALQGGQPVLPVENSARTVPITLSPLKENAPCPIICPPKTPNSSRG